MSGSHHNLEYREWRNEWLYLKCSCGALIGPFFSEDVAADCFNLHIVGCDDKIDGIAKPIVLKQ